MNKTGMKETLMKKTKYITFLGKYKHFFRFGAKKLHSLKYKNKTRIFFLPGLGKFLLIYEKF